jgi:hypothetical protein
MLPIHLSVYHISMHLYLSHIISFASSSDCLMQTMQSLNIIPHRPPEFILLFASFLKISQVKCWPEANLFTKHYI